MKPVQAKFMESKPLFTKSAQSLKEEKVLEFWEKNTIFEKTLATRKNKKPFVFFEGPPSANGKPGIHHAITRAFKDIICRYKTMRGYFVLRKGGWDTHGLPIEIQVEKELGFNNKQDIERYGIDKFNKKAREIVWQYKDEWERFTKRIGFWLDMEKPYITYDNDYIESVWWILQQIWKKKLLYKDYKVVPYCPRCGTALSSHEVAQGYEEVTDMSVYVKFRIIDSSEEKIPLPPFSKGESRGAFSKEESISISPFEKGGRGISNKTLTNRYLLAWTTTPWTLPGNVALAVGSDIDYVEIKAGENNYILAKSRLEVVQEEYTVVKEYKGKDLIGLRYRPLFNSLASQKIENIEHAFQVYPADFVTTEDGTGIVHTAVMYGEDDFKLGQKVKLPKHHTVDENGKFKEEVKEFAGEYVKNAEKKIIEFLEKNNFLYTKAPVTHSYPFCWRCKTPLLYYAKSTWFIAVTKVKKDLIKNNEKIHWTPAHLKEGRFGEWLREIKDWALSRERYWGTPLPIWQCDACHTQEVIGSLKELDEKRYYKNNFFILRHGQATHNIEGNIGPVNESEGKESRLSAKGEHQIKNVAKLLKKYKIDLIVASDIYRIRQTAEIVKKEIDAPITFHPELRDINNGSLSFPPIPLKKYHSFFKNELERFEKRLEPEAENLRDVKKRMWLFVEKLNREHNGKNILIIGHGDPLWLLEATSKGLSDAKTLKHSYIKNGEIHRLIVHNFPYNDIAEIDIHRPYIDNIVLKCNKCGSLMHRVKEVIDVWFDSGAMPIAQWHYPFENQSVFKKNYPADYIAEAIDQTRGWFYTLHAIATLLGKGNPYKHVISVSHILDEKGKKMSKSKGNVVDPWYIINRYSNDALRWYLFTINSPGEPKKFKEKDVAERLNKFIATIENSAKFYQLYKSNAKKSLVIKDKKKLPILDQWILSRLNALILEVTNSLDDYKVFKPARAVDRFVDELSNWYIRRSRRRLQRPENNTEKETASQVLGFVLLELSKLIAPFIPFVAEDIYQTVKPPLTPPFIRGGEYVSVHLTDYPQANKKLINKKLEQDMEFTRRVVALGLNTRVKAGIKVRQPLRELKIKDFERAIKDKKAREQTIQLLQDELNVQIVSSFRHGDTLAGTWQKDQDNSLEVALYTEITPELRAQGIAREIIRQIQDMRKEAKYNVKDIILIRWSSEDLEIEKVLKDFGGFIQEEVIGKDIKEITSDPNRRFDVQKEVKIHDKEMWIGIVKIQNTR